MSFLEHEKKTLLSQLWLVKSRLPKGNPTESLFLKSIFRKQQAPVSHFFAALGKNGLPKHVLRLETRLSVAAPNDSRETQVVC